MDIQNTHIYKCLMAQHDDEYIVEETIQEIKEAYEAIVSGEGNYMDVEELLLDHGIDLDGVEELIYELV